MNWGSAVRHEGPKPEAQMATSRVRVVGRRAASPLSNSYGIWGSAGSFPVGSAT